MVVGQPDNSSGSYLIMFSMEVGQPDDNLLTYFLTYNSSGSYLIIISMKVEQPDNSSGS